MRKKQAKQNTTPDIEAIAERAERGEDVSGYFTGEHLAKQFVQVDFPLKLLRAIDAECRQIGVTRQAWIKMACDERLRQIQSSRIDPRSVPAKRA
jgi:hypothetical protein